jgi:hypothetical protein
MKTTMTLFETELRDSSPRLLYVCVHPPGGIMFEQEMTAAEAAAKNEELKNLRCHRRWQKADEVKTRKYTVKR